MSSASLSDTLRPILEEYRAEVQPHWSPATAHPDFDGKQGDPAGQCGVTSAWLKLRLLEDHGITAWYSIGTAYRRNGAVKCHWRTRDSLTLHGVTAWDNAAQDWLLTDAGRRLAYWNARTP